MIIEQATVRLLNLKMKEQFSTSQTTYDSRPLVVVKIETETSYGWGECSALAAPGYSNEFTGATYQYLVEKLVPQLIGTPINYQTWTTSEDQINDRPMAKASIEMALLDIELKTADQSLAAWLGVDNDISHVKAGAAIGLAAHPALIERAQQLISQGFSRLKLKISPQQNLRSIEALRNTVGSQIEIHLDGNGSFSRTNLDQLVDLAQLVQAIEQPFPAEQISLAAELIQRVDIPIVVDEGAPSIDEIKRLVKLGAASGVSIKAPRLGGITKAAEVANWCCNNQISATPGGMIESGLGRHALVAVAAMPGFDLTGDISPARRWLADDPWPDIELTKKGVEIPSRAGIAPDPNEETLEHYTIAVKRLHAT